MIRTFLAIELDVRLKKDLYLKISPLMEKYPEIRWCNINNLHLTLHFFGDINTENIEAISVHLNQTGLRHKSFCMEFEGVGYFAKRKTPRVLFISLKKGEEDIQRLVYDIRRTLPFVIEDTKLYVPHLTIGRVRKNINAPGLIKDLEKYSKMNFNGQRVTDMTLFSSELAQGGAVHTPITIIQMGSTPAATCRNVNGYSHEGKKLW